MSKQNQEQVPVLNISEALLARSEASFKPTKSEAPLKDNMFRLTGVKGLLADEKSEEEILLNAQDESKDEQSELPADEDGLVFESERSAEGVLEFESEISEDKDSNTDENLNLETDIQNEDTPNNIELDSGIESITDTIEDKEGVETLNTQEIAQSALTEKLQILDNVISETILGFEKVEDELTESITATILKLVSQTVGEKIDSLPEIIEKKIETLCTGLVDSNNNIRIFLSELDHEIIVNKLDVTKEKVEFVIDTSLSRGEVRVKTENLEIIDTLPSRIESNKSAPPTMS